MSVLSFTVHGSLAALPTPYRFGRVDLVAFDALCHRLIELGTTGLVPCGTTGEAALLSIAEQHEVKDGLRLPLTPLSPEADRRLVAVLDHDIAHEDEEALRYVSAHPLPALVHLPPRHAA